MADVLRAALKDRLALVGVALDDDSIDARLDSVLADARAAITAWAGRSFTPVTTTKYFDAPAPGPDAWRPPPGEPIPGSLITVPDLQTATGVTAFGTALTEGTDYQILTYLTPDGLAAYTRLLRVNGGAAVPWVSNTPSPWLPYNAIAVTGTWGGYATVPGPVTRVTLAWALAYYWDEIRGGQTASGNAGQGGTTAPSLTAQLDDLKRQLEPWKASAAQEVAFA